ncbi:MAG: dTMP kinase [Chromatiales bacterium]|jgi:dTMP kinase
MNAGQRGRFITVEGTEGVGKSTQLQFIEHHLSEHGLSVKLTREPGGTAISEAIRGILLSPELPAMHENTELLLMFAARSEHLHRLIVPALERGEWVVCDRFTDATYAYQGGGRGVSSDRIGMLENWVQGSLRPDATILLDAPVEVGLARARRRSVEDRFEQETRVFFERVRGRYHELVREHPQRFWLVDAARPEDAVRDSIGRILDELVAESR